MEARQMLGLIYDALKHLVGNATIPPPQGEPFIHSVAMNKGIDNQDQIVITAEDDEGRRDWILDAQSLLPMESSEPRGWVFLNEETREEVGFAEPHEYKTADDAVQGFGREYAEDFIVYFRDNEGVLHSCGDEDEADDFN